MIFPLRAYDNDLILFISYLHYSPSLHFHFILFSLTLLHSKYLHHLLHSLYLNLKGHFLLSLPINAHLRTTLQLELYTFLQMFLLCLWRVEFEVFELDGTFSPIGHKELMCTIEPISLLACISLLILFGKRSQFLKDTIFLSLEPEVDQ